MHARLEYTYTKPRTEFGRQCIFSDASFVSSQLPDRELRRQFIRKDPIDSSSQGIPEKSTAETSTVSETFRGSAIKHTEGGWPKDVNIYDEEQTARYRKRIERDGKYEKQLKRLLPRTEHTVTQNNAVNVMEEYFDSVKDDACSGPAYTTIDSISCFVCPGNDGTIAANHISFSAKAGSEVVIAYADVQFPIDREKKQVSCVWDTGYSQTPILNLESKSQFIQLEYNRKDDFIIAGGRADGIVSLFDTRLGGKAQLNSDMEHSHKDFVSSLQWIQSKTNTEFFTGAGDGQVKWWDTRSMAAPYESYTLEMESEIPSTEPQVQQIDNTNNNTSPETNHESSNAPSNVTGNESNTIEISSPPVPNKHVIGCTVLEFIQSMPSRFSVGTQNGTIFSGNKRGASFDERFPNTINCFASPVRSLERNPFSDKNFIAIGDCAVKVWSDDNHESCIWSTRYYNEYLTCGCWNKNRGPTFFVGRSSGSIDVWDLLLDQKSPIATLKKTSSRVLHIESHHRGNILASAHENGHVHLLQASDNIASNGRSDRPALAEMFERETKRDKNFFAKVREYRMLMSKENRSSIVSQGSQDELEIAELDTDGLVKNAEQEFEMALKIRWEIKRFLEIWIFVTILFNFSQYSPIPLDFNCMCDKPISLELKMGNKKKHTERKEATIVTF